MPIYEKSKLAHELFRTIANFFRIVKKPSTCQQIKQSEYMLLVAMKNFEQVDYKGVKISDLSHLMQITPAAITHMINSLEEGGCVERLADSKDRRVVLVKPTVKGNKIVKKMHEEKLELLQGLVNYLGEHDTEELIRIITSAITYFEERRNNDNA